MRRIRLVAAVSTGLALVAGAAASVSAGASGPREGAVASTSANGMATVRRITGDSVTVTRASDGRQIASVTPGAGRRGVLFRTQELDGHLTVLASHAGTLVASGRLDRQLFDVTALVAQKYDEAHTDALPLIVGRADGVAAAAINDLTALAAGVPRPQARQH
ncbi:MULTISPECIES: hypothetical protein [Streptomyces]|uniref:hypothetical protein n=1 Tax=Streptomyces TaxID=1883 RepID=UPI0015D4BC57|nr:MULTISPECIES: hypothetical protein [Streptomyces]